MGRYWIKLAATVSFFAAALVMTALADGGENVPSAVIEAGAVSGQTTEDDGQKYAESNSGQTSAVITVGSDKQNVPEENAGSGQHSAVITAGSSGTADEIGGPGAGSWKQDENGWYYVYNGVTLMDCWRQIKNVWYYFGSDGYMCSNAWVETDGKKYRVDENGAMLLGPATIQVDGTDYELDESGALIVPPKTEEELAAESMASRIVASITNDGMSKQQKAAAIYSYVRGHMTYSHINAYPSGYTEAGAALYGFRRHSGNCYVYYSMSHYLLEMAGMPNIRLVRASDGDHFWNLVNVDGTWYHFDTTPYKQGGSWCLVTTGVLRSTWNIHNYDVGAYPATP